MQAIKLLEDLAAPVGAFVRDWCKTGPDARVNVKELYRAYTAWADENGQKALAQNMFGKELHDVVPMLRTSGVGADRAYVGVTLSEEGLAAWGERDEEFARRQDERRARRR